MQSLDSSFEFKKVAISTASRVVSLFIFVLSPSHRRRPVEFSLEDFCVRHLFSTFLSFWSKILNHTAWRPQRVQGHTRDKMTQSPPFPPSLQNCSDLSPSLTRRRSRLSNCVAPRATAFSFATTSRVSSSAFSPPPASTLSVLLSSCSALLPFLLSLLWLVGFSRSLSCYFHTVVLRL